MTVAFELEAYVTFQSFFIRVIFLYFRVVNRPFNLNKYADDAGMGIYDLEQ